MKRIFLSGVARAMEKEDISKIFWYSSLVVSSFISWPFHLKELAYYNEVKKEWLVESGTYKIKIGNSSRNIVSEVSITVNEKI